MKRKKHKRNRDPFAPKTVEVAGIELPVFEGPLPVDEVVNIACSRCEDQPDLPEVIPSEVRVCAGECGKDVWVSKTMLNSVVGKREYKTFCLYCIPAVMQEDEEKAEQVIEAALRTAMDEVFEVFSKGKRFTGPDAFGNALDDKDGEEL